jgi:transcriptional regulator with XRE-family HTH domain
MPTQPHEGPIPTLIRKLIARCWGTKACALAAELGVDDSTVSKWASGRREPSAGDLQRILAAAVLACPSDAAVIGAWVVEALVAPGLQVVSLVPDTTPRVWEREQIDGQTVETRMAQAVLDRDPTAFEAAAEDAERELRERLTAGRQRIEGSGLRVAR